MNVKNNSTSRTAGATVTVPCASIDALGEAFERSDGLISSAEAVKHLSELLMNEIDRAIDLNKGRPGPAADTVVVTLSVSAIKTIDWLSSQLCLRGEKLADLIDEVDNEIATSLSNASYEARKAVAA